MRGYWSRICAVCLLSVPWAFAWNAYIQRMFLESENPAVLAKLNNPAQLLEIHKKSLETLETQRLWIYIILCVVLPSIYVSLVELVAYLIRRTLIWWRDASKPTASKLAI
jgi:hypothetical protein